MAHDVEGPVIATEGTGQPPGQGGVARLIGTATAALCIHCDDFVGGAGGGSAPVPSGLPTGTMLSCHQASGEMLWGAYWIGAERANVVSSADRKSTNEKL